ncbi:MAG TPA: hypothetical protein PKX15_03405 [Bacteroidales bacterium]|nr:hypothetical protein [Bacteroidales bacterium]
MALFPTSIMIKTGLIMSVNATVIATITYFLTKNVWILFIAFTFVSFISSCFSWIDANVELRKKWKLL